MTTVEISPELKDRPTVDLDSCPPGGISPAPDPARARWRPKTPTPAGWITAAIGAFAAVLYTWNLSAVGMGNSYYAAAVKSGTVSWKAFFFGSIDAGSFITVDKPPAALWLQELSGRILGFGTWSMLLPEALAGVASVLLLHHLVRKWMGDTAAHIAAISLAVTPVALQMFRYNNPDALLTLLCLGAAAALWSALESGRTRMLVLSGALIGLAFQTKMLQAFLVLPAFILVYLWAGKPKLGRRIAQMSAALGALILSAGWWVAIVALWPAASRPYIGSTQNNSILSLVFGYNGLSRLFGGSSGGPAGGSGGSGFGGTKGILRMFNESNAGGISWLLPLAGIGLLAGLWLTRRNCRTDLRRAGWLLWGGWAVVSLVTFSLSSGIFHQYYSIQVAPAVAALAGAGGIALWRLGTTHRWLRAVLPLTILGSAAWAVVVLDRTPAFAPWLRTLVIMGAIAAAGLFWLGGEIRHRGVVKAAGLIAAAALLAGPTAYSLTTAAHPQTGSILTAGPSSSTSTLGLGFGPGGGAASTTDTALVSYLEKHQGSAKYLVAAFSSNSSESIIIASGKPVITIGGFNGGDPAPTLAQFERLVKAGQVRYVLVGNNSRGGPGGGGSSSIASWVTSTGKQVRYGGNGGTLYDLSAAAG